jgi:hypothetical protein
MFISDLDFFKQDSTPISIEKLKGGGGTPIVYVSPIANAKMQHYVDLVNQEVGWLGTVEELESGDYLIEDVFLFDQQVSSVTTEISEDGLAEFATKMLQRPDGMEIMNKLRFWGHSHVDMPTGPSGQDNEQMEVFADCGHDFFIRGIYNKRGDVNLAIYDYKKELIIKHPKWKIYVTEEESLREDIEAEISEKVKHKTYTSHIPGGYNGSSYPIKHYNNGYNRYDDDDSFDSEYIMNRYSNPQEDIDDNMQEMTEEEFLDLHRKFNNNLKKTYVEHGKFPDDPKKFPYIR